MPQSQNHVATQKKSQGEVATIHKPFLSWLHKNNLLFVYHRPDKRSGIATGWPDFTICHCGKCLLIEAKTPKGSVTPIQHMTHVHLKMNGNTVIIARSVPEAISAVQAWLGVEKAATEAQARQECPLDNERAAELVAAATNLSGGVESRTRGETDKPRPERRGAEVAPRCSSPVGGYVTVQDESLSPDIQKPHLSGSSDPPAQNLWIGSLYGTDYVFRGDFTAGSTAEKVRRATITDIQTLPRR